MRRFTWLALGALALVLIALIGVRVAVRGSGGEPLSPGLPAPGRTPIADAPVPASASHEGDSEYPDDAPRPQVVPDTAPGDARLRAVIAPLLRIAVRRGATLARSPHLATPAGYAPPLGLTLGLEFDSTRWSASAWDAAAGRQCAARTGRDDTFSPFVPLPAGEIRCRALPWDPRHTNFGRHWRVRSWAEDTPDSSALAAAGAPTLEQLLAMTFEVDARIGGLGIATWYALRGGCGITPGPDEPGPPWGHAAGPELCLADVTWGDVNGDGRLEAVVHVIENSGGSGFFGYLAVVRLAGGRAVNGPLFPIGDRTALFGLRAAQGRVSANLVVAGPNDGACCPTDTVHARFAVRGDYLVYRGEGPGRLSR